MVARAGRCCGTLFKGYFGVTQVDTLSPTTINLVVDAVIQKWVIDGGSGRGVQWLQEGGADDSVVFLLRQWHPHLQGAFDVLTGIFNRFGLRIIFGKTVGMVCNPCGVFGHHLEEAYERRMAGEGLTYQACL